MSKSEAEEDGACWSGGDERSLPTTSPLQTRHTITIQPEKWQRPDRQPYSARLTVRESGLTGVI